MDLTILGIQDLRGSTVYPKLLNRAEFIFPLTAFCNYPFWRKQVQ